MAPDDDAPARPSDPSDAPDRRRVLGLGAAVAAGAWAAPAILSLDAAAAQTPGAVGGIVGTAFDGGCQGPPLPIPFASVEAQGPLPGGTVFSTVADGNGDFSFTGLTPGTYDLRLAGDIGVPYAVAAGPPTSADAFGTC